MQDATISGLIAYPSKPPELVETIRAASESLKLDHGVLGLEPWEENDVAGHFLVTPILDRITRGNVLVADITRLNFNVTYEIGYAIGLGRRVLLVKNKTLTSDDTKLREVGLFDTLGYENYHTSAELSTYLAQISDVSPLMPSSQELNKRAPVYLIVPRKKADSDIRMLSRIKKARLQFRTFDPEEHGRLSAREALDNVSSSLGVAAQFLSSDRDEADAHNYRVAFVAGLAGAMGKRLLLLQFGSDPVPLDYRDLVRSYWKLPQIDDAIADFSPEVTAELQADIAPQATQTSSFLSHVNLGASSAENELNELQYYYLQTDEYLRTLRGEVQIVTGRKGAGKTALFSQLRNKLRRNRQNVVLDLKPEGYQLIKFKERVLDLLEEGAREHTVSAFWEYVLLLELCHKLLEKDQQRHLRDHNLYEPYQQLAAEYGTDSFAVEGDFAERALLLTERIAEDFQEYVDGSKTPQVLGSDKITELVHKHNIGQLRRKLTEYLASKGSVWILFDNLDKGWPTHGLAPNNLLTIRCLLDAIRKLERSMKKADVDCHGVLFIRNDVFEWLVDTTPDRGKVAQASLDWTDPDLLRELVHRRLIYSNGEGSFDTVWRGLCVSHVRGEESSQYLIDRSLMRPRSLLDLISACRSHAVNLGHTKIEEEDMHHGERAYSADLVTNIGFELRDILPEAGDVLYELIEAPARMQESELRLLLSERCGGEEVQTRVIELLLWFGVLGFVRQSGEDCYIYNVNYDVKRLLALVGKLGSEQARFCVNPAFWTGLEIRSVG